MIDLAVLERGHAISAQIETAEQAVKDLLAEVTADNARRLEDSQLYAQLYAGRVLASLQSARTDLGTFALAVADDGKYGRGT